jgi:hypothetical protein
MQTTSWILALGLPLLIAGCTGDTQGDDTSNGADARNDGTSGVNQSGSRIKMTVLSTPDGAKAFMGWRDTELDLDCNFQLAADGAMRCLPVTDTFQIGNTNFGDAACTIPVATRSGCAGQEPRHILRYPDQTCPAGGFRVFQAGTKYTAVYVRTGGSCVAVTPSPTITYYAVGAELPPSTFQAATSAVE